MPVTLACARCQAAFTVPPAWVGKRRYCSAQCRAADAESRLLPCEVCGARFRIPPSHIKRGGGRGRFCGLACAKLGKRIPIADRFWSKVDRSGGCWIWKGARHEHGYGRLHTRDEAGRRHDLYAHRIAWEMAGGRALDNGEEVCHTCDEPACVRNDERGTYEVDGRTFERFGHLFAATQVTNNGDRDAKDRVRHGSRHANAKLTETEVERIRTILATGAISQRKLARAFGVNHRTISDAMTRKTWKRV